ncbi:TetR/AcrR family transcriptional regulator [Chelatococcus asaccharovorans]|uniref:TetR family transcriptional regulator n=1 Tax=Chelatococcus asaccharovorans TaxID=28210 RepID=A0A2V3ULF2_9HYPH|nr:TetR/AcrR family transcriptional regulator [Chelatococcus asaccharovorans]MBS7706213.1 TetR family transcriptional regulator [Chelatococcus asaccharovorans]PXW65154.1 TetR family transcriptional regulator [Chelatococcus asaccharovorans]CAH1660373.1 TetR family transcriptional regulator [Chelatococcus asaccharovorans]CAH1683827.1 TetR family transcriptional regulator [Chelatococcus asaccharovorans]
MAQPARKRLSHEERRREIMHVAKQIIHRKGFEAASLQDIADALNMKKASLYYYFGSKEELLQDVLAAIIGEGMALVRDILASDQDDPLTRLWRLVASHIHHLCANVVNVAVFLHERKVIPLEKRKTLLADDYAYQAAFIDTIRAGQQAGQIRADVDAKLAALSLLGSTNWTYTWFKSDGDLEPAFIGRQFATMTINSLANAQTLGTWQPPAA